MDLTWLSAVTSNLGYKPVETCLFVETKNKNNITIHCFREQKGFDSISIFSCSRTPINIYIFIYNIFIIIYMNFDALVTNVSA